MGQPTVTVMMTCFNRCAQTVSCLTSLAQGNPSADFHFIITDDNSSDGTPQTLQALPYSITLLAGDGQQFWNGGMRMALACALESKVQTDYYLLVNDDVLFYEHAIAQLIERACRYQGAVIVGATADQTGRTSYGGVRLRSKYLARFELIEPSQEGVLCDTFNGNCVLLPREAFIQVGNLDPCYRHSMSDYDYGMEIRRKGILIYNSAAYVGCCDDNDVSGSWRDASLSRRERLRRKESPKGLPWRDWYHFIRKNYGFFSAIYHSITPYARILLGK